MRHTRHAATGGARVALVSLSDSDPETGGRSITPPCLRQYPRWVLRLWSPVVAGCTASSYIGTSSLNPLIRLRSLAAPLPYLPPVYGLPTFLSASACTPNHLWHLNRTVFYPMAPQRASGILTWSSVWGLSSRMSRYRNGKAERPDCLSSISITRVRSGDTTI